MGKEATFLAAGTTLLKDLKKKRREGEEMATNASSSRQ